LAVYEGNLAQSDSLKPEGRRLRADLAIQQLEMAGNQEAGGAFSAMILIAARSITITTDS
jgi:hypothetical protein